MFMMIGVYAARVPAADWKPAGWIAPAQPKRLVTTADVAAEVAWRTPQFWLLWAVLCMNVTAGIGVLGQASPMIQEVFTGPSIARRRGGFVGLISLFEMGGRFVWGRRSDYIGRRNTFMVFFRDRHPAVFDDTDDRASRLHPSIRRGLLPHSSPCTAAVSPPSQPTCAIFSAPIKSAPFMAGC